MAEVTPLPTPERPPSPHPSPLAFGSFRWQTLWTAVGGLAGAAGLVYGVGSAIEAIRLNAAGLPVEQALSLVPKTTVLALAINALLLPAVVSGAIGGLVILWAQKWTERTPDPDKAAERLAKAQKREKRREERRRNPSRLRRAAQWIYAPLARWMLVPALNYSLRPVWRWTLGRVPPAWRGWTIVAVVSVAALP